MNIKCNVLIVALAFAVLFFNGSTYAEEYTCRGSVGIVILDNVRVPQGATCTLHGTQAQGTIYVEANATLRAYQVNVIGNVQAENAALIEVLSGSTVGGSIQIKQGGGARIDGVRIDSDLQFDDNHKNLIANRNTIGGNLQAFHNTGGLSITSNTIDGNLQCKENRPPPTGGDNIVKGSKEDQCANLSPAKNAKQPVTEENLIGSWTIDSQTKLKVSKIGSGSKSHDSTIVFNQDGTFTLTETDSTLTYNYTGEWSLIKGKKISFAFDAAGQSELVNMLTNWSGQIATEKGFTINNISFSEITLTISQASIPKKTLVPRKMTIRVKGLISATLNGQDVVKRFSYINKVSFLNRQ